MNREEIIAMAREAGFPFNKYGLLQADEDREIDADEMLAKFAALVAAKEREACILEIKMHTPRNGHDSPEWFRMNKTIDEIRARGQQ